MRFKMISFSAVLVFGAEAQSVPSKLLNLVPSDARFIFCLDVDRYRQSQLAGFYPIATGGAVDGMRIIKLSAFNS